MRPWTLLLLGPLGCGGLFEQNPGFVEDTDSPTSGDDGGTASDGTAEGSGTLPDSGSSGVDEGGSGEGSEDGNACVPDSYEFNDEYADAYELPGITPMMAAEEAVMLEGFAAVDWYTFDANQQPGDNAAPKVFVQDVDDLRVCVFAKCVPDATEAVDCGPDEPEVNPQGHPGCCGIDQTHPIVTCNGAPDSDMYISARISDAIDRAECIPHTLEYSFWTTN